MKKLLIWDFDNTIAYRTPGMWHAAMVEAIAGDQPELNGKVNKLKPFLMSGFPWHDPEKEHTDIKTPEQWWENLFPVFMDAFCSIGISRNRSQELCTDVRNIYINPNYWKLFDDTEFTLKTLSERGWTHVILSNHVPELESIVEALGIRKYFENIFNSAITGYEKPNRKAFEIVLSEYPDCERRIMIGDSLRADIKGAESVGIGTVWVNRNR